LLGVGEPLIGSVALKSLNERTAGEPLSLFHGFAVDHTNEFHVPAGTAWRKDFHQQVGTRFNSGLADERDPLGRDIRHVRIQNLLAARKNN